MNLLKRAYFLLCSGRYEAVTARARQYEAARSLQNVCGGMSKVKYLAGYDVACGGKKYFCRTVPKNRNGMTMYFSKKDNTQAVRSARGVVFEHGLDCDLAAGGAVFRNIESTALLLGILAAILSAALPGILSEGFGRGAGDIAPAFICLLALAFAGRQFYRLEGMYFAHLISFIYLLLRLLAIATTLGICAVYLAAAFKGGK